MAVIGLILGGVFGLVGTLLTQRNLQAASCVRSYGLADSFSRVRQKEFAGWVRLVGIIGSILFAITSARVFWGEPSPVGLRR